MIESDYSYMKDGKLVHVQSPDKCLDNLRDWVEQYRERIAHLEKELKHLRDEYDKDSEVAELKAQLQELKEDSRRGFLITAEQQDAIHDWYTKHVNTKHDGSLYAGAIGGELTYSFIPTGIGVVGTVTCVCGESFTFSELD
jgi:hypothetical protein